MFLLGWLASESQETHLSLPRSPQCWLQCTPPVLGHDAHSWCWVTVYTPMPGHGAHLQCWITMHTPSAGSRCKPPVLGHECTPETWHLRAYWGSRLRTSCFTQTGSSAQLSLVLTLPSTVPPDDLHFLRNVYQSVFPVRSCALPCLFRLYNTAQTNRSYLTMPMWGFL